MTHTMHIPNTIDLMHFMHVLQATILRGKQDSAQWSTSTVGHIVSSHREWGMQASLFALVSCRPCWDLVYSAHVNAHNCPTVLTHDLKHFFLPFKMEA